MHFGFALNNMKPKFPITVHFLEEDDKWLLEDEKELAYNLEWLDSDDDDEKVKVTDDLGRRVRLKVEGLKVIVCECE